MIEGQPGGAGGRSHSFTAPAGAMPSPGSSCHTRARPCRSRHADGRHGL